MELFFLDFLRFFRRILRQSVAGICHSNGFHSAQSGSLDAMTAVAHKCKKKNCPQTSGLEPVIEIWEGGGFHFALFSLMVKWTFWLDSGEYIRSSLAHCEWISPIVPMVFMDFIGTKRVQIPSHVNQFLPHPPIDFMVKWTF